MKRRLDRRGSVLLLVVVLLAVISLLAAAAVTFSHSELGAARNERTGDELLACADAGRQYMLSRFDMFTGKPAELTAVNVDINAAGAADCPPGQIKEGTRCARSGHIGQQVSVSGITVVESKAGGDRRALRDLTNSVGKTTFDGVPHKITVHCLDENGRGTEVEFVVRFGL
ncbi:PilX N-terminal domain-containing pilus assembly protein [Archangium lipolyticum]|uniref:PilX N-terminal domain-containing pilus assembly protein n=1 Tax=Archangium lipolyticum TaxID=2970465 RepID=UPI00214A3F6A|nr:PilX N-terminal domain-containing pilus assembly protein [Archangium lipolyticum]